MVQCIAYITFLVRDYDQAIHYFTQVMDFQLLEDTCLNEDKRWVLVSPPGNGGLALLLARASNDEQLKQVGNQAGGRVFLFIHTDDFWKDYERLRRRGVLFLETPRIEKYGIVAVFSDLYGNRWDLLELSA